MKRLHLPLTMLAALLMSSTGLSQEFWEYEPFEDETELHQPTQGLETEYEDDGDIEVEREGYEWEAGEGYHEEEWYDPSDWFNSDNTVNYEDDTYDGAYDGDSYGYGYDYYDYYDYDYDYTYDYDYDDYYNDEEDVDYKFDQKVAGRIEALQRIRGAEGAPRSVRLKLKTDDGETRTLHLGDLAYVNRYLPKLQKGEEVVIGGNMVEKNGRQMFQAKEMRNQDNSYMIPDYQYDRRVRGELKGLRKVRMKDSDVELVVARVETEDGKMMDVRLGDPNKMEGISRSMRPGAKVRAEGYKRMVDGKTTFVVQDFKVQKKAQSNQRQARKSNNKNR